jgi:hypothetical protein
MRFLSNEVRFLVRVGFVTALVVVAKVLVHAIGGEVISLNALFTGIIAANVFLMGFLLSGVLSDYKESERLPGELSACLENMAQEVLGIGITKPDAGTGACLTWLSRLTDDTVGYFYKKVDIADLLESVNGLTPQFEALQPATQGTFIARLKQEQSNLRRTLIRINTIRETSFVSTGYLLADLITFLLCVGLVLTSVDPFYESLFFAGIISYLMIFLLMLIRDLDNPFGYYEASSSADVTLQPLQDTAARLARLGSVAPAASVGFVQLDLQAARTLRAALDGVLAGTAGGQVPLKLDVAPSPSNGRHKATAPSPSGADRAK